MQTRSICNWEDTWAFLSDETVAANARRARQFSEVWTKIKFEEIASLAESLEEDEKQIWELIWKSNAHSIPEKQFAFQLGLWAHSEPVVRRMLIFNEILTARMFSPKLRSKVCLQLGMTADHFDRTERAVLLKLLYGRQGQSDLPPTDWCIPDSAQS